MPEQQKEAKYWEGAWKEEKILWQHNGDPKMPHIVHPGTRAHSDTFFHCRLLAENSFAFSSVTLALAKKLLNHFWSEKYFQKTIRVVGVGENSITLAHELARNMGTYGIFKFAYTARFPGYLAMTFPRDTPSLRGEEILLCADEILSVEDIESSAKAVRAQGGAILPLVATIFNGSGLKEIDGKQVFSLINHYAPPMRNNYCSLCEQGSETINPYDTEMWNKLFPD